MPYLFARNGSEYTGPHSFARTVSLVNEKAAQWGGRYRVKPSVREDWSKEVGRPEMTLRVTRAMKKAAWGGLVKVEMGCGNPTTAVFLIKKVMPEAPDPLRMYTGTIVDLSRGNERIAKAAQYAKDHRPRVLCSGWVYTRYVAGTTVWSQHSNFPTGGNAVDLTVYVDDEPSRGTDMDATQDVCDTLVAAARAGHLELDRVIFRDQQYRYPGFAATDYSGVYHTHVHAEARPVQTAHPVDA